MKESVRTRQETATALLIGARSEDIEALRAAAGGAEAHGQALALDAVPRFEAGLARVVKGDVSVVLLDLSADTPRLEALRELQQRAPDVPIIALVPQAHGARGVEALDAGAADYLLTSELSPFTLARAVRHGLERRRLQRKLQQITLVDEASGLYTRRGFVKFADQQLKLLRRMGKRGLLLAADIQGLQQVNARYGHAAGDVAIADTARILQRTFRDSDVIGRLAGDVFAVLALGVGEDGPRSILRRLSRALARYNAAPDRRFGLNLHLGVALAEPTDGSTLDRLLDEADRDLLDKKRRTSQPHGNLAL